MIRARQSPSGRFISVVVPTGGPVGSGGADGADGRDGSDGNDGLRGATGGIGATGPTGADGADGLNGRDGADGLRGATGATGATGPAGADGTNGRDGVDGTDGVPGAQGPTGPSNGVPSSFAAGTYFGNPSTAAQPGLQQTLASLAGPGLTAFTSPYAGPFPTLLPTVSQIDLQLFNLAATTSHRVGLPSTRVAGDRLIICFEGQHGPPLPVVTPIPGWTTLVDSGLNQSKIFIVERTLDGTETDSIDFVTDLTTIGAVKVFHVRGADPATPTQLVSAFNGSTFGTSLDLGPLTPSYPVSNTLWIGFYYNETNSSGTGVTGFPAELTNTGQRIFTQVSPVVQQFTFAWGELSSAVGSLNLSPWLYSGGRAFAFLFAIAPPGVVKLAATVPQGSPGADGKDGKDGADGLDCQGLHQVTPNELAAAISEVGCTFAIRVPMTATGAGADDIVAPPQWFPFRVLRTFAVVETPQLLGSFTARNATGGGGAAVSPTFGATVASDDPNITANNGNSVVIAAGGTLAVRRNNGNITGEVIFLCMRT